MSVKCAMLVRLGGKYRYSTMAIFRLCISSYDNKGNIFSHKQQVLLNRVSGFYNDL